MRPNHLTCIENQHKTSANQVLFVEISRVKKRVENDPLHYIANFVQFNNTGG